MGFTLTKKRFLIWKTVMMVVAGLVVGGAIKLFWPEHYFVLVSFYSSVFLYLRMVLHFYVRLLSEVYAA